MNDSHHSAATAPLSTDTIRRIPKALLHDHLDGGLRPATVIELAQDVAEVQLPTQDPSELSDWFFQGANTGSLARYLEGFGATVPLMQTQESLERIAFELIEDLHAENVIYTEVRFAPDLHILGGLNLEQVMKAVLAGLRRGRDTYDTAFGLIVCSLRNQAPETSLRMAELAIAFRAEGAVAFDLAGDEVGHPPKDHLRAFQLCLRENFNITVHAGEAFGTPSIWQAIQYCGAHRIGHGTRLIEDMVIADGRVSQMGTLAQHVLDRRIPLEICLQSNVHTGATPSLEAHPFRHFYNEGFRVTLNTDNRLMSRTTLTDEYEVAHRTFGLSHDDLEVMTLNALKSSFTDYTQRVALIRRVIDASEGRLAGEDRPHTE